MLTPFSLSLGSTLCLGCQSHSFWLRHMPLTLDFGLLICLHPHTFTPISLKAPCSHWRGFFEPALISCRVQATEVSSSPFLSRLGVLCTGPRVP